MRQHCFHHTVLLRQLKNLAKNCSVVFINSIASQFIVSEQNLGYHLSKAALENFVKYNAVEYGKKGSDLIPYLPEQLLSPKVKIF